MPTAGAVAAFAGSVGLSVLGIVSRSWPVVVLGGTMMAGLSAVLAVTMPLGRRVRRHRLEFAWWLGHAASPRAETLVAPGRPFEVRCFLRHRGRRALELRHLLPVAPPSLQLVGGHPANLRIGPNSRNEFTFRMRAPAAGRLVLHGLAVSLPGPLGLFEVPLYFPNPLTVKILPQQSHRMRHRGAAFGPHRPFGRLSRSVNTGSDLRELRELHPGDPFKSIAWKASARTGRLMVRESDAELQQTSVIVCDVSCTMRTGTPGRRKLDYAIEAASAEAGRALAASERIGLVAVDGRVVEDVPPADGGPQFFRILEALLAVTEVVDHDLTSVDDREVVAIVGRYLRHQDGVDFRQGRGGPWNLPLMLRHVRPSLEGTTGRRPPRALSAASRQLRQFCRERGIPLPYLHEPRDSVKAPGLAQALRSVGERSRQPTRITALTDLDELGDLKPLVDAARRLRHRGHTLAMVVTLGTRFVDPPFDGLRADLLETLALAETHRLERIRRVLLPLRVKLRAVGPETPAHCAVPLAHALQKRPRRPPAQAALVR